MVLSLQTHQLLLLLATLIAAPPTSAIIGTSVAAILKQRGWSESVNGAIAWSVLLITAAASVYATNGLTGGYSAYLDASVGILTLLVSGPLSALRPYLRYLDFVEANVFNIVKADSQRIMETRVTVVPPEPKATGSSGAHGG